MNARQILKELRSQTDPSNVSGMEKFGINPTGTLGVSMPKIRKIARSIGKDHNLAGQLWASKIHEARILAGLVDDPKQVTRKQMDSWAREFDSWDVCDQVCMNLFDKTPYAYEKSLEWSCRQREFVKRASFALMASLAVHDKKADDSKFRQFLPVIARESTDERNFVKKAVNWALRQIGKRNMSLNTEAIKTANAISRSTSRSARWIASDALKELRSDVLRKKLEARSNKAAK